MNSLLIYLFQIIILEHLFEEIKTKRQFRYQNKKIPAKQHNTEFMQNIEKKKRTHNLSFGI